MLNLSTPAALLRLAPGACSHGRAAPLTAAPPPGRIDSSWAKPVQGGEGSACVSFVANTLKPRIDRQYRTLAEGAHTGIGGTSMGGLNAIHAGVIRPDAFSRVGRAAVAVRVMVRRVRCAAKFVLEVWSRRAEWRPATCFLLLWRHDVAENIR